jgi:transcriptional regulator with XRE-family HTH domain
MGTHSREKPVRVAEKLGQIRFSLGLSQDGMIRRMGVTEKITREDISKYERALREPSLLVLQEYARAAGIWLDVLVDDELDLPQKLPSSPKSEGIRRKKSSCSK